MKKTVMTIAAVTIIGGTSAYALAGENEAATTADLSVLEKEASLDGNSGTETQQENRITAEEAVEAAKTVVDGTLDEVKLNTEDGLLIYEVELDYEGEDYDIDVDAETGEIVKVDGDLLGTEAEQTTSISIDEAEEIVLEAFSDARIDDLELEKENGRLLYELEVEVNEEDGDVYVDAESGEILHIESDILAFAAEYAPEESEGEQQSGEEQITPQQAKETALAHVGSGYVDDIELEHENGLLVYEVEVEHASDDVDVYIDAYTGEVVYVD